MGARRDRLGTRAARARRDRRRAGGTTCGRPGARPRWSCCRWGREEQIAGSERHDVAVVVGDGDPSLEDLRRLVPRVVGTKRARRACPHTAANALVVGLPQEHAARVGLAADDVVAGNRPGVEVRIGAVNRADAAGKTGRMHVSSSVRSRPLAISAVRGAMVARRPMASSVHPMTAVSSAPPHPSPLPRWRGNLAWAPDPSCVTYGRATAAGPSILSTRPAVRARSRAWGRR